jgi:hypothetical protein
MGTDNQGNRIPFGSPTTDYGAMQGEYWGLGRPSTATRYLHAHMTDVISGTGGPHKPNTRFSPTHFAFWSLLGCSGPRGWPHDQAGRKHLHAGNAERSGNRPATLASVRRDCHSSSNEFQDGLEIDRRACEV